MTAHANRNGGSQPAEWTTKNITSAELLAWHTTSVELLPELSGRFYYVPQAFVLHYRFGTAPYVGNLQNDLVIGYGSTVAEISGAGNYALPLALSSATGALFTRTTDSYMLPPISNPSGFAFVYWWPAADIEGKALSIGATAPLTDGDGTLTVRTLWTSINGAA